MPNKCKIVTEPFRRAAYSAMRKTGSPVRGFLSDSSVWDPEAEEAKEKRGIRFWRAGTRLIPRRVCRRWEKSRILRFSNNCTVNADNMGDSTDGEREDMQWQEVSKKRRDWSDSSGHSGSEFGKESKKVKANGASVKRYSGMESCDCV